MAVSLVALLFAAIAVALFSLILLFSSKKRLPRSSNGRQLPPSPHGGLPLLGHLHLLGSLHHRTLRSLATAYGPVMLLRLGSVPTVVASSAAAAEEVMKTRDLAFASRPRLRLPERLSYGRDITFAPYGDYWRQARRICVLHVLSLRRILSFSPVREKEVATLLDRVRRAGGSPSGVVNLSDLLVSYTNTIISRAAFGDGDYVLDGENGGGTLRKVLADTSELLGTVSVGEFVPWLAWVDTLTGLDAKATRTFEALDGLLERIIADHRQQRRSVLRVGDGEDDQSDFVDVLLDVNETKEEDGGSVSFDMAAIKALIWKTSTLASSDDKQPKRQSQAAAVTGYASGSLGIQSPSLSDLEKQKQPKKKRKYTKAAAKKVPKPLEQSGESYLTTSATEQPTQSAQVAKILADLPNISTAPTPVSQPTPIAPTADLPESSDPTNLLGFSLSDLDDPEIMATDDYDVEIRKILQVSKEASTVVTSEPGMREKLNKLFDLVTRPQSEILTNSQPIRDAMAAVEADLPPEAMAALLTVCHLDERKSDVEAAQARIQRRQAQEADQKLLNELVADARAKKRKFDTSAQQLKSTKESLPMLEKTKKLLLEELAKLEKQIGEGQQSLEITASELKEQKLSIAEAVDNVTKQSAKVKPVPGNAKDDDRLLDEIQEIIAKAAGALSALGATLPDSGI